MRIQTGHVGLHRIRGDRTEKSMTRAGVNRKHGAITVMGEACLSLWRGLDKTVGDHLSKPKPLIYGRKIREGNVLVLLVTSS